MDKKETSTVAVSFLLHHAPLQQCCISDNGTVHVLMDMVFHSQSCNTIEVKWTEIYSTNSKCVHAAATTIWLNELEYKRKKDSVKYSDYNKNIESEYRRTMSNERKRQGRKGKKQNKTERIEMKWSNKRMQTTCEEKQKRETTNETSCLNKRNR